MGILDDAIREHLDLKRRLGAAENELARLEDEAFGPPSRPGDPDFPADETGDHEAAETQVVDHLGADREPRETSPGAETALAEPAAEQLPAAPASDSSTGPSAVPDPAAPPTGEQAPTSDADPAPSGDPATADAPAIDPDPTPAPAEPPSEELEAEPQGGAFFDQADESELELDLDLDEIELEDAPGESSGEPAEEAPPTDRQPATEAPPEGGQPPIESLDTVEHHFEEAIEDTGDVEVVEGELTEDPPAGEPAAEDGEEEDVLEETPEFLRDQPEDDELWFEQGEPKDFDF